MNNKDNLMNSYLMDAVISRAFADDNSELRQVLLEFLEVLDSLDRLVKIAVEEVEKKSAKEQSGLLQVLQKQLFNTFKRIGVEFFDCKGQPFNPNQHEAIKVFSSPDFADNIILEEVVRGCNWKGKLLRSAKVIVARNFDKK